MWCPNGLPPNTAGPGHEPPGYSNPYWETRRGGWREVGGKRRAKIERRVWKKDKMMEGERRRQMRMKNTVDQHPHSISVVT